jgi:uncharacterized protein YbcC (UPF0753/DUF2309 family)
MSLVAEKQSTGPALWSVLDAACSKVAPTWPLDRFIAVNPFWEMVDSPMPTVSTQLTALSGARLLMPRAWYRQQHVKGVLTSQHLERAIADSGSTITLVQLLQVLGRPEPEAPVRQRVMDVIDAQTDETHRPSWRSFVIGGLSQFCASYFDDGQASVRPSHQGGLYSSWRRHAQSDVSPQRLMGERLIKACSQRLPETAEDMAAMALEALGVPEPELEKYLLGLLLDLNGWASWCAYQKWDARLRGSDDTHVRELLVIRLAWEWMLLETGGAEVQMKWRAAMGQWPVCDAAAVASNAHDWLFQRALEYAWQDRVSVGLSAAPARANREVPASQVVFCIDVRSEVFRRALEAQGPDTRGFAGFFGLPIEYQPPGSVSARPQLPGLLAPQLRVTDGLSEASVERRVKKLTASEVFGELKRAATDSFAFVESLGLTYAFSLLRETFGRPESVKAEAAGLSVEEERARRPRIEKLVKGSSFEVEARCQMAEGMLRAMSLTQEFAPLVVLVGHGSQTRNNAHAAGLDCGACCGQTGEVNARAAAALLNEPQVREGLLRRGIVVPSTTYFLAGLHNTTTDEVTLLETDLVPPTHAQHLVDLRQACDAAGRVARRERAPRLGLSENLSAERLLDAVKERAGSWAEVRPEWGLANNAAFIVAPRSLSKHYNFQGRAFLHDYHFEQDADFKVLELIMTAPMVVTHWINLQYYASTVDNVRYGSGNKLLHNVVGGHLGVFEGNGGDLRVGLPLQSVHDGAEFVHTPQRLSVFIAAPVEAITAVLHKHPKIRALVENEWLFLFQLDASSRTVNPVSRHTSSPGASSIRHWRD